jgi:hypothetical protein
MHHLQGSFVGRTAALNAGLAPANFVPDAQRLIEWSEGLSNRGPAPLVHSKHGHWQSNRTDCGDWMYSRLAPEVDVPIFTRPVREKWRIPAGTEFYTGGPEMGERKSFAVTIDLWSNGETVDGLWRRIEYHNTAAEGEDLWVQRSKMTPLGTRNPTSGFGEPVMSAGYTQAQLDAAKAASLKAGKADMHAKAIVEAEEHLTEIRALK